jgi:hypothetical protein
MAEDFENVVKKIGKEIVADIMLRLKTGGKVASKTLINSVSYQYKEDIHVLEIYAESYFRFIEDGRKSGKQPPLSKIKTWCTYKGLPQSAAFPIARKIGLFGIPPKPILSELLEARGIDYQKRLEEGWYFEVKQTVDDFIQSMK